LSAVPPGESDGGAYGLPPGLVRRRDGVFFDLAFAPAAWLSAVNSIFLGGACFAGLDYASLIKGLYNTGPELPRAPAGSEGLIRFAEAVRPIDDRRRELYKALKINHGAAEYYFESVFIEAHELPDGSRLPAQAARLDFDEFVADLWNKGVRFGIDAAVVRAIIASGKVGRIVVARRLEPMPGRDAQIVEVSQDMHRSDAPKVMANGRLDLLSFQNRFPQIKKNQRLLKKVPPASGLPGYELSGALLPPAPPADIDLQALAGAGTLIERQRDGEYLVAAQDGYLNIEGKTSRVSISEKIISRDGVSGRTTGNLQLSGAYEEFGEVQERRVVDGSDITIHGDVFGNINSRGGHIHLLGNLVGGSALNAGGDIRIDGVASGAMVQTRSGTVTMARGENCVISATRVVIAEASNCEIFADEVEVGTAEGCAIAGRRVRVGSAAPRRQAEMLLFALVPDMAHFDRKIDALHDKSDEFAQGAARRQRDIDGIANLPDISAYLALAKKVRKQEIVLEAEQLQQFQKMAVAAGPALKAIGKLSLSLKEMQVHQKLMLEQANEVVAQKRAAAAQVVCAVAAIDGDIELRTLSVDPEGAPAWDKTPKEIKAALRAAATVATPVFAASEGALDWTYSENAIR
jgi:hypothetical protein